MRRHPPLYASALGLLVLPLLTACPSSAREGEVTGEPQPLPSAGEAGAAQGAEGTPAATGDAKPATGAATGATGQTQSPTIQEDPDAMKIDPKTRLEGARRFSAGNNAMAFALLRSLPPRPTEGPAANRALSPASIEFALTMTARGAEGDTRSEMLAAMGGLPEASFFADGAATAAQLGEAAAKSLPWVPKGEDAKPGVSLHIANRLFGQSEYEFQPAFLDDLKSYFGAPLERANFRGDPDGERKRINEWVAEKTADKIDELLPDGSLDSLTRLVLVNAVYFKAAWQTPFNENATTDEDFTLEGGERVKVPTMRLTEGIGVGSHAGATVVELDYVGAQYAMVIVMPPSGSSLGSLVEGMDGASWSKYAGSVSHQRTELHLPRFRVDPAGSIALKAPLQSLGMKLAFEPDQADFSQMANPANPDERLYVSKVFHKAFVDVAEAGTEAAAATAVVMAARGAPMKPPEPLRIDRPFIFGIHDKATGTLLFLGEVGDPRVAD